MAAEGGTAPVPARRWRAPVWHREQPLGPGGNRRARPAAEGAGRLAVTPAGLGFAPEAVSDRAGRDRRPGRSRCSALRAIVRSPPRRAAIPECDIRLSVSGAPAWPGLDSFSITD